jgi:dihydroneopterin aldolase
MDKIKITDLEVFYQVGVADEERAKPQRLLVSVEMEHDFRTAISRDNLAETLDYFAISQRLLRFGEDCHWQLIETLARAAVARVCASLARSSWPSGFTARASSSSPSAYAAIQ